MCKPVGPVSTLQRMIIQSWEIGMLFILYFYIGLHTGEVSACAMLRNFVSIIKNITIGL